jgi:hypothetical protein
MANLSKRTPEKDLVILDALREWPTFTNAARKAKVSRNTLNEWRRDDPDFDKACLAARDEGFDAVEDKLIDRTRKGDTTAMIFLLKGRRRPIYGERQALEHSGPNGGPIPVQQTVNLSALTDEELAQYERLAEKVQGDGR